MTALLAQSWVGWLALALASLGAGVAVVVAVSDEEGFVRLQWSAYEKHLDSYSRFLLLKQNGAELAKLHLMGMVGVALALAWVGEPLFLVAWLVLWVVPTILLERRKAERIEKIESQLDGWLLMLANALKATPAIGEAIKSTVNLVQVPIAEELDLLVKENQLGTPLDVAVLNASERIGSSVVSGALATLIIARQTGGDLSSILETSATSLREMARLEGVVRSKTAEGKGQAWVLGAVPFILVLLLGSIDENWLRPLTSTTAGYAVIVAASVLWAAGILWARKILAVDI